MIGWLHVTLISISGAILALALLLILKPCFNRRETTQNLALSDTERGHQTSLQSGIARLHQVSPHHHHLDEKANYYQLFRRGSSAKPPPFSWSDHPSLVTDAVENGWSRFAFAALAPPSSSVKSSILGPFAGVNETAPPNVEMGWDVCEGSADYMQKIRFNPNLTAKKNVSAAAGVIRSALPLPGPNLGNSSFPQEAYFEVTVVACNENASLDEKKGRVEGDKIKLIGEDFNAKNTPDSLGLAARGDSQRRSKVEEGKKYGRSEGVAVCVGLMAGGGGGGGNLPLRVPGSYPGSIGFNSTGSVYLDGTKIFPETEKYEWEVPEKVIGCGYSPILKKVFFTVDAQLVHEIHCKTEEFRSPLYPTIAANVDATVLVNLGQSPFKYGPANLQRTPNPCFVGPSPMGSSPALGYDEDSRELFSMGRIDAQWLQRSANRSNNNTVNSIRSLEYDQESEGDLFEIVLESIGRSPYATSVHQQ